jgi:heme-degrading monooxygenase HmoA
MPAMPWKSFGEADPEREYLCLLTYLPLTRVSKLPAFLKYVRAVQGQLEETEGVVGYALLAKPFSRRYWTLSAWESEERLSQFVREAPHRDAMGLSQALSGFTTTRFSVPGSSVPPSWDDALARATASPA